MIAPTETDRDAEIAARYDDGESLDDLALAYNLPRSTVGEIVRRLTDPRPVGRRPSGAVTPRTARGRSVLARLVELSAGEPEPALELLARLLAIAAALGVEPGAVLARLEAP